MSDLVLGFVGDLLVNRKNPTDAFDLVRPALASADILFGNLECAYTDEPQPVPSALVVVSAPADNLDVYAKVGFKVLAMATNHILDVGYSAMLQTRSRLMEQGIRTCGAGGNVQEAREPAIVNVRGRRIAYLAYCCGYPAGYEARGKTPGIAPMRGYRYVCDADPADVNAPLRFITVPDSRDQAALAEDIQRARAAADSVVTSFHWGDYTRRFSLTDHEKTIARFSIDQGADMVVGHHHHVLRGMEWYRGKPIMYGLGHLVFDLRWEWDEELLATIAPFEQGSEACYDVSPRPGWPLLPMHEDARMTVVAWATVGDVGVREIGFLPCRLTPEGHVRPLEPASSEAGEVVRFLEQCNATQGMNGRIVSGGSVALGGIKGYCVEAKEPFG